jgi:hypothetical protein
LIQAFLKKWWVESDFKASNWMPKITDIKSAFLPGKKLDREVYIKPPVKSETAEVFV